MYLSEPSCVEQLCFNILKFQAVHIEIIDLNPEGHHKWSEKETPEEMLEDREAIKEEAKVNEMLVRHRTTSCNSIGGNNGGGTP